MCFLFINWFTKTNILIFYRFLILIDLNKLVYLWLILLVFFSFLLLTNFMKCILLYDSLVVTPNNSCFDGHEFHICPFFYISHDFSINWIINQLEIFFSNLCFTFFLLALHSHWCMVVITSHTFTILIHDSVLASYT